MPRFAGYNSFCVTESLVFIFINTFVHSVYLYDDHLTIINNGGKGQIIAETIPFKKIEKSLKSGKVGTNLCSAVVTSVPPNKKRTPCGCVFYLYREEIEARQYGTEEPSCS